MGSARCEPETSRPLPDAEHMPPLGHVRPPETGNGKRETGNDSKLQYFTFQ